MVCYLVQCSFSAAAADRAVVDTTADDRLEDNAVAAAVVAAALDDDVTVDNTFGAGGNSNSRNFLNTLDSNCFVVIPQALTRLDIAVVDDLCEVMQGFHSNVKWTLCSH